MNQLRSLSHSFTKKHPKFQIPRWPGSVASRLAKYTKEILKNTKEKSGKWIIQFLAINTICRISKMVGCQTERFVGGGGGQSYIIYFPFCEQEFYGKIFAVNKRNFQKNHQWKTPNFKQMLLNITFLTEKINIMMLLTENLCFLYL